LPILVHDDDAFPRAEETELKGVIQGVGSEILITEKLDEYFSTYRV